MIVRITGILEAKGTGWVQVRVGGVSLQIFVPTSTIEDLGTPGEEVQLHTHLQIREEEAVLYGFSTASGLNLFRMLNSVTGVGPRTALGLLSSMSPESLATAIATGNVVALMALRGVGKKTAERLVLELKSKLEKELSEVPAAAFGTDTDVVSALMALGYSAAEARQALASIGNTGNLSLEEKVRRALQGLARG